MAVGYPVRENVNYSESESNIFAAEIPIVNGGGFRLDGVTIAAVVLLLFLGIQLIRDRSRTGEQVTVSESITTSQRSEEQSADPALPESITENVPINPAPILPSSAAIVYPYDEYWLTQGPHGFSYGHMAIDLSAGKGVAINSPIHGTVTANYVDQYGNTTLVIENERYQVTLLHGNYTVTLNQAVSLGDVVGSEGNNGYTTDMYGNSCRGRDCGYHTHLNVFDLAQGLNVNPLDVLGQ